MTKRIKNTLKNIAFKIFSAAFSKKIMPAVALFSVLGITFPLKFAHALFGIDKVVEIFQQVFEFIFTLPFLVPILMSKLLMSIAIMVLGFIPVLFSSLILNLVLSDQLIILPYTRGGIVDIGWLVSRDIANMLLVIIVIIIAVSTMLGNESRGIRNLLPKLVVVALLLNFTKVIAGVVVDIANIITNYLLSPITNVGNMFIGLFGTATPAWQLIGAFVSLAKSFSGFNFAGVVQVINVVMKEFTISAFLSDIVSTIAIILVAWMMTLTLLIYAFVFFFRYIAIWLLVIISPLAFVAMILPDTSKFARQWWDKFLHWAFIGIGPAFTLYLTALIINLRNSSSAGTVGSLGQEAVGEYGGIIQILLTPLYATFSELLFWIVILVFMFVGMTSSLKMSKAMPSIIVKWGSKGIGAITSAGKNWAEKRVAPQVGEMGRNVTGSKMAQIPIIGAGIRKAGETAMLYEAKTRERGQKAKDKFKKLRDHKQKLEMWLAAKDPDDIQYGLDSIGETEEEFDRTYELARTSGREKEFSDKFGIAYKRALSRNEHRQLRKLMPTHPEVMRDTTSLSERVQRLTSDDIVKKLSRPAIRDENVMENLLNDTSLTGSTLGKIIDDNPYKATDFYESARRTLDKKVIVEDMVTTGGLTPAAAEAAYSGMSTADRNQKVLEIELIRTGALTAGAPAAPVIAAMSSDDRNKMFEEVRTRTLEDKYGRFDLSKYLKSAAPRVAGYDLMGESVPSTFVSTTMIPTPPGITRRLGVADALAIRRRIVTRQRELKDVFALLSQLGIVPAGTPVPVPSSLTSLGLGATVTDVDTGTLNNLRRTLRADIDELRREEKGEL